MRYSLLLLLSFLSCTLFAQNDTVVPRNLPKNAEYFSKGLEAKYNENYPLAIANFEQALMFFSEDDASMYELSALYQQTGRISEALSMIQQAADLQPDNKWYQIRLAQLHLKNSDYQTFIKIYDKLIEAEPGNLEYVETYIDVLLRVGDFDKVLEKLDILEQQVGKNEYIYLQKIQIYDEQGKKDKAIQEMEKLVEFMPDNTRYRAILAEAYRKVKRDKDAYQQYLKIKELDPEDKYVDVSLMDYYLSIGDVDKAFDELISAIKNKNLDFETKSQIYDFWFEKQKNKNSSKDAETAGNAFIETHPDKSIGYYILGTVHYLDHSFVKAKEYYKKALDRDNKNYVTLYQITMCCFDLREYQEVIAYSERALSLYPEQPLFYFFNGLAYYNTNDYDKAIAVLEKGRKLSANKELTASFDMSIGDTYIMLKNHKKAFEAYDRVLRSDPNNINVLNNYAYYLSLDNQDLERALEMSAKTIKAEPKNATYLDTYAWVLYKLGRYQEAKKYMDKVFKYDKNPNGTNYEHYGDILYKLGDKKNAVKNWKKAKNAGDEVSEFLDQKIKDEKLYE